MKRAIAIFLILAGLVAFVKAADVPVMVSDTSNSLTFTPKIVNANVGDNVVFTWAGTLPHSVIESDAVGSCNKSVKPNAFTSGGSFTSPKTFSYTPTANGKQWFYCGVPGHCQAGMFGTLIVGGSATNGTTGTNGTASAAPSGASGTMSMMPSGTMTMMPSGASGAPAPTTSTSSASRNFAAGFIVSSMCMAALML